MNTDQKLPAESAGERPSSPLFGHAISHAATLIGRFAIVLWGFMAGLVRLVSESFGATLGSALIYTVGGIIYGLKLPIFDKLPKDFGSHEIFHLFVMGGSICHFIFMYAYLM